MTTKEPVRRRRPSAEVRAAILTAAEELFAERGFPGTSTKAIAERAQVSEALVFTNFGTKAALMDRAVDIAIAGDDEPIAVMDRAEAQAAFEAPTAEQMVEGFSHGAATLLARAGRILAAADAAAHTDPELAEACIRGHRYRLVDMRRIADALDEAGALRAGLDAEAAADLLWILVSPDTYRAFTVVQGWDDERYRRWLADTMARTLLA